MDATELHINLQRGLGSAYTLERELGGGGMSRVFVAEETALGRRVVVKVLGRELTEGLSAERFAREMRLAARLPEMGESDPAHRRCAVTASCCTIISARYESR